MTRSRPAVLALLLVLTAAPAVAQDDPAPKDADAAEEKPKAERKVSEKALERLNAWGKAMHLPSQSTADRIEAKASAENQGLFNGGELSVTTTWDRKTGLEIGVTLPEEMTKTMPPQALEMAKGIFKMWSREALAPAFEAPSQYARDYHVAEKKMGETTVVELLPYTDNAAAEVQRLEFDDRGLCTRRVMIPKVDPATASPEMQMMVGVEIDTSFEYEKVGERYVLKQMSMLLPFGDMIVDYGYYEVTAGPPLLKTVKMSTPFSPDPIEVTLSDYQADGNAVPETKKPEPQDEEPAVEESEPTKEGSEE